MAINFRINSSARMPAVEIKQRFVQVSLAGKCSVGKFVQTYHKKEGEVVPALPLLASIA
jgi:hypothetical protein